MIIWRGWGIIGVGFPLIGIIVMMAIYGATGGDADPLPFVGIGVALGGIGAFLLGRHLNEVSVDAKAEKYLAPRKAQLDQLVQSGQFQMAPGMPQPSSMAEAQAQAGQLYESEQLQVRAALKNRHTVFWIPAQWFGAIAVGLGLVLLVLGMVG